MAKYRDKRLNEETADVSDYYTKSEVDALVPTPLTLGETSGTAYRGDRGKTAYDHSQVAHAPSSADNTLDAIANAGSSGSFVDGQALFVYDSNDGLIKQATIGNLRAYFDTIYAPL